MSVKTIGCYNCKTVFAVYNNIEDDGLAERVKELEHTYKYCIKCGTELDWGKINPIKKIELFDKFEQLKMVLI